MLRTGDSQVTQVAEPIVGRDAELAVLDRLLDQAREGEHTFAVLSGAPGIGKTSLLTELASRAEERGCLVLEGRATELERELPFGLLVDTFDAYLESLDPRTYDRLAADGLEELASVFPPLRALGARIDEPRTAAERFRAHHAVRELIERLAVRQPLVLVFDDIHWSDGASLELLGYLLRRPAQAAVLAVTALRPGQATSTLTATIEEGVQSGQLHKIILGPLAQEPAETLVDADPAEADRLYRESGGNPFYLLQLARSGVGPGGDGDVPAAVSATIAREVDGLEPAVRRFVEAAAVAGDPFELDLAVAVAELPETEAFGALDELIARDFVRPGIVPRRFEFRHPLVRAAVYDGSSPGGRLVAHERAAEVLAACAATEQLLGRREDAHRRLQAALGDLSEHDSTESAALMFELALDAFYGQDFDGMCEWGRKSVAAARASGDRAQLAATAGLTAFACSCAPETIAEARALHDEAAELLDALSDDELAAEMNAVAWLPPTEFYLDRYPEGIAHAERGLAVARATGQSDFFPGLIQALANLLFSTGRPVEAAQLLDDSLEAARLSDNVVGIAWSLLNRSYAAINAGEVEEALRAGEKAVELTAPFADSPVGVWSGEVLAQALVEAGKPERGYEMMVERAGPDLVRVPGSWRAIWLGNMAGCLLALGRVEEALRSATLAEELAQAFGLPLAISVSHRAAAAVALERGDATTAAERALTSAAGAEEIGARPHAAQSRMLAGRALAAAGDEAAAVASLEQAAAEFDACGAPRYRDAAEHELRKLGRAVHRRTERGKADGSGIEALTGRELEVARLVVDRRTNLEIAAELFLSIKTVETHMRNIFRKLGVSSRVEVARVLERTRAT